MAKEHYLNNKSLLEEIKRSKEQGRMTDELGRMLTMLVNRFTSKANLSGYTYIEDMKSEAIVGLVKTWHKFDETRFNNPFAFYTQCAKNSIFQVLNKEKKARELRDHILEYHGLNPSTGTQVEYEAKRRAEKQQSAVP